MTYFSLLPDAFLVNRQNARQASVAEQRPVESDHGSRRVSLDANARPTQSFFPRMPASFSNVLRRIGLCSQPSPALSPSELKNRETYRLFRSLEQGMRMKWIHAFRTDFDEFRLPGSEIHPLHLEFDRKLTLAFAGTFPANLSKTRQEHSGMRFADALCKAYALTANAIAMDSGRYAKPYAAAMRAPIEKIASELKAELEPDVILSWVECDEFRTARSEACGEMVSEQKWQFEADNGSRKWPGKAFDAFKKFYLKAFDDCIVALPPSGVSRDAMHAIHFQAIEAAKEAAVTEAVRNDEFRAEDRQMFRNMLAVACDELNAKIGARVSARLTGQAQA